MNKYGLDLKLKIVFEAKKHSTNFLSKKYQINQNTIKSWIYTSKKLKNISSILKKEKNILQEDQILEKFLEFTNGKVINIKLKKEFIKKYSIQYPIRFLCEKLRISRGSFYYQRKERRKRQKRLFNLKIYFWKTLFMLWA